VGQRRLSARSAEDRMLSRRVAFVFNAERKWLNVNEPASSAAWFRRWIAGLICLTAHCVSAEHLRPSVRVTPGADKEKAKLG